ncbi:MAG TPA: diacylglycerol kinase family protein [Candidatus Acidoferrales bacterium]|nr:diacylglycerol kinase family protein [Candidatus Acidoferrales bacterium]
MSSNPRNAVLIVNPAAGGGRRARHLDKARRVFLTAGIETELQDTAGPGEATTLAQQAVSDSRDLVIVCGGDGTVNEVVNGLACSHVPLAVLPAGTANVLAKELRLPWNLSHAAERIVNAQYCRIALGLAIPDKASGEPRYFLSVAGAGADGALVSAVRPEFKRQAGVLAYWKEGLWQLTQYDFPLFRTQMAGSPTNVDASLVIVGRTKHYGGPFKITTEADLLQPEFELAFVTTRSAWRYLAYMPLIWAGKLRNARYVQFFKTSCLRCATSGKSPVHVQVDGEPAGSLPVEFRIVPDALTLAIPHRV